MEDFQKLLSKVPAEALFKAVPLDEIIAHIPTKDLLRAAKERNAEMREKLGNFGAQMKPSPCPYGCGKEFGVRKMREHKKTCKKRPKRAA